ncbi:deoxynucleoside kinase [Bacillus licheniformis]|uniref:deoxynucleoside kinase n=1 Tax=Bacillus licheniformis TaxID=1402 RepID=UPI00237CA925|nr:deoxynucleoside kinase [Bacillus licheniformis]MDE1381177.1 deoxynucleoside kinase [Bacillus licheniformis]
MTVIVTGGMIGLGKTSVAELLGKELGSEVFYESVENNPILPLFYTASDEEIQEKRYPFLLQLYFLQTRFEAIKQAYKENNNVLDRSIYEDWYFAKVNHDLGRISDLEFQVYEGLLNEMMKEIDDLPYKKAPDLMVYLKASFETVMLRIGLRGRDFEQDQGLVDYYRTLWEGYDEWVQHHYKASEVLIIDMDKTDVVNNPADAERVVQEVKARLGL